MEYLSSSLLAAAVVRRLLTILAPACGTELGDLTLGTATHSG